jgi:integrase
MPASRGRPIGRRGGGLRCQPSGLLTPHRIVKQILAHAIGTQRLADNAVEGVQLPRVVHREDTALTCEQISALVAGAGDAGPIILTLANTGLRFGELVSLRVGDVDLDRRHIQVSTAVAQVTGAGLIENTPKAHQVRRAPILTHELIDTLERVVAGRGSDEYLFPAPDGGPMRNSFFRWRFDRACEQVGLSRISPKTLRHTAVSLAIERGAPMPVVQTLLGHRKSRTTLQAARSMKDARRPLS